MYRLEFLVSYQVNISKSDYDSMITNNYQWKCNVCINASRKAWLNLLSFIQNLLIQLQNTF